MTTEHSGLGRAAAALRRFQDAYAAADAPADVLDEVAETLSRAAGLLSAYRAPEADQVVGRREDLVGYGQTLVPAVEILDSEPTHVHGRTVCGPFFHGSKGIAHGGVPPLLLDDVMGRFANSANRPPTRTAYLNVDYRAALFIDREIHVTCQVDREDGRKRWLTGEITSDGELVASAEGLFIALRPDHY